MSPGRSWLVLRTACGVGVLMVVLAGCRQSVQVLVPDASDASTARLDGAMSDGSLAGVRFGSPRFLFDAVDVSLSDDELELYCVVADDLMVSRRGRLDDPWPPLSLVTELNSFDIETDPTVSGDGRTMFFTSYRDGGNGDLFVSTRIERGDTEWSPPVRVPELSSPRGDCCAVIAPGGNTLLFASFRTGDADIYRTERVGPSQPWSPPRPVDGLNVPQSDDLTAQWRAEVLVMDSTRAAGGRDIYLATVAPDGDVGVPEPVSSVNGPANDRDAWISVDGRRIYFQSDREGVDRIYVAERP